VADRMSTSRSARSVPPCAGVAEQSGEGAGSTSRDCSGHLVADGRPGRWRARRALPRAVRAARVAIAAAVVATGGPGAVLAAAAGPQPETRAGLAVAVAARDIYGRQVSGATVEIGAPAPFAAAGPCGPVTGGPAVAAGAALDGEGGAVLPVERPGVWRLIVRAPKMMPVQAFVAVDRGEEVVPGVALEEDLEDQVRFVDPGGHALAGASVVAESSDPPLTPRFPWTDPVLRGESGGDGLWRLPFSGLRIWRLGVKMTGYEPWSGDMVGYRQTLRPVAERLLRLLDAHGRPVAAARLWEAASCAALGATDARGEIAVAPALVRHRLVVAAPDGRRWSGELVAAGHAGAAGKPWQWRLPEPHPPLAGRLLAPGGSRGVAGAVVWSGEDPAAWTRSDQAGHFRLPWPVRADAVEIHVRADGFLPVAERRRLPAGAGEVAAPAGSAPRGRAAGARPQAAATARLEIVLAPARQLAGRVLDEAGQPIAGAEIAASARLVPPARARSGADGSFLLREVWPDGYYTLTARAAGHGSAELHVGAGAAGAGQAPERLPPFALCRQIPVAVTVRDTTGAPVAGAAVTLRGSRSAADARSVRTAPDGSFSLPAPLSASLDLAISAPEFTPFAVTWQPATLVGASDERQCEAARELPRIELARTFTLAGRVVDRLGEPIAGAEVWDATVQHRLATTGPDGRFGAAGLDATPEGKVWICHAGFEPALLAVRPPVRDPVAVTLGPATQLEGTVVREDGSPAAGIEVAAVPIYPAPAVEALGGHCPSVKFGGRVRTDAAGHFLITPLLSTPDLPEWYRVAADDGAHGFAESVPLQPPAGTTSGDLRLVLGPRTTIVGRYRDAAGEAVVGEVGIQRLFLSTRSDEEGRFTLGPLHPGDEIVEAEAAGGLRVSRLVSLHPGDNEIDLALPARPLRRIAGRLVDAAGAPAGGVTLSLVGTVYHDQKDWTHTNPDGGFVFVLVPEGGYKLSVRETFAEHRVEPATLQVAGGDVADLVLRYLALPEITVRGRVAGGEGRPGMKVEAEGPAEEQTAAVGADGSYRLEHLVPGSWHLTAGDGDSTGLGRWVLLAAGQAEVVEDLVFAPRKVSGRVVDRLRQPVPDLFVRLGEPGEPVARTAADGTFSLSLTGLLDPSCTVQLSREPVGASLHLGAPLVVGDADVEGVELVYASAAMYGRVLGLGPDEGPVVIRLLDADGVEQGSAITAADGGFALDAVAPGRWRVEASLPGGEKTLREITVPLAASAVEVELAIERGNLALEGRLTGASDPALFSVEIEREDGSYQTTAQVDSRGAFRFGHLAPGDYLVTALADTDADPEKVTAGRQQVTLHGNAAIKLAIDASVRAVREAPLEPVD
jgi:carboxypeptidase family protein